MLTLWAFCCCKQPESTKSAVSDLNQKTLVTDWSKAVSGIYCMDDRSPSGSDISKTNMEVIAGIAKKKLIDEDVITEDFFAEKNNRFLMFM